ncbi:MAG: peptidylprolyl isomerase [Gammaproteobacteria bacterium]|nr:peptidylprolyl isomerase [Gammaproteobacteria bacterium]MBS26848.1 peptidylprolyl isomerase [Gammaproteobacteria bacterium]|tara:strand:- start:809 stop:1420 length:612 start_codon:yes stop_codon:yes gene_type:complete
MARIFRSSFRACVLIALIFPSSSIYAQGLVAIINTSKGVIEAELNDRAAPTTVANFINLAIRGFYDGLTFHRVERNFMVQGGDPLGNGSGGPGYRFAGEIILKHNQPGILSMANSGPGTDGSQFFLTHLATPHLDGLHSVFGKVINGQSVIYDIRRRDVINSISIQGDPTNLFKRKAEDLETWNNTLDLNYPDLKPAFDVGNN